MPFYAGRDAAFWKPSPEDLAEIRDPLSFFPSEPDEAGEADLESPILDAGEIDRTHLQGLAAQVTQTCSRVEQLAQRTEAMLDRVEQLAADTSLRLGHAAALQPPGIPVLTTGRRRARVHVALTRLRIELHTQRLLARRRIARYVRRPLRPISAVIRKRLVVARVTTTIQAEALLGRAMTSLPSLTTPGVIVVIRTPRVPRLMSAPAFISASGATVLMAVIAPLLMAIRPPIPAPVLPWVAPPTLATIAPPPVLLDALFNFDPRPMRVPPPLTLALPTIKPAATPSPERTLRFLGTLVVESEPAGATVFINRERVGQTPLTLPDLRAGSRAVWVESDGYQRWTAGVLVPADKLTRISVKLQREPQR
jgi:hypothetical protein